MNDPRFDRQIALFGTEGQAKLRAAHITVIGAGGTGSAVIPQLALLGVGQITMVDHDEIEKSNRNRHFCARHHDPIPGTLKVETAKRMIQEYDPTIAVRTVPASLVSQEGFEAVRKADYIFGCVDLEGIRLILTELCAAYRKPYIDISTGVEAGPPARYGGQVCCAVDGNGCLMCLGQIDTEEARRDLESVSQRADRQSVYGVDTNELKGSGPSVVSINAVTASLAVTEFMKLCTGLGRPTRLLQYDGRLSRVTVSADEPANDCYYCKEVWGSGANADVERYLRNRTTNLSPLAT